MLTSAGSFRLGDITVFRDIDPDGAGSVVAPQFTGRFFLLPDSARLVHGADGAPAFDAVWYRGPAGTRRAGALISLTIALGVPDDRSAGVEAAIRAALPAENFESIELLTVPFIDGSVQLSVGGGASATVPARLQGDQRATVVVELDADQAAELFTLLERGVAVFDVAHDLTFGDRLTGVELRVWCDGRRAHELASAAPDGTADPAAALTGTLIEEHSAGVELTSTQPLSPDHRAALDTLGRQLLAAGLRAALGRPYDSSADVTLNQTFSESSTVPRHAVGNTVIGLGSTTAELGDRVRIVDLAGGFFAVLEVAVLCTIDFTTAPIELVQLTVDYDATGTTGRVSRSAEYVFRAGDGPQRFRTDLAGPDLRAVSWRTEVYYVGDPEPVVIDQPPVETTLIVLDLDGTGVLAVEVSVREPQWERTGAVTVALAHPSTGHTALVVLDAAHPTETWTQVVRTTPGPVSHRCTWHTPHGDLVQAEETGTGPAVTLDVPAGLRSAATVELIAAGAFDDLAQLIVDVTPGPETPVTTGVSFAFTAPGQQAIWSDPALRAGTVRFLSRQTQVHLDGSRDELGWVDHDGPVLVVGDLLRCVVIVEPRLLDLGGSYRIALLELVPGAESNSPAAPSVARSTLVFTDRSLVQRWAFRMPSPGASDFRYRLTLVSTSGERMPGAWIAVRTTVLVLVPPAPVPLSPILNPTSGP